MNCRRVVAAVGAACVAGSFLALPAAAQEESDPPAPEPAEAPVGDLPAAEAPLVESRPPATPRTTAVEEPVTIPIPETVPETTIAPLLPPAPIPSHPSGTLPPSHLGKVMRSAVEVDVEADGHVHADPVHADSSPSPTGNGNQAIEAVLVVLTISLLAGVVLAVRQPDGLGGGDRERLGGDRRVGLDRSREPS